MTNSQRIALFVIILVVIGGVAFFALRNDNSDTTVPGVTTSTPNTVTAPEGVTDTTNTPIDTTGAQPQPTPTPTQSQGITRAIVAQHNTQASCYTIVDAKVYDLTDWINKHPGGKAAITSTCGVDATAAFTRQHGSSAKAQQVLASYFVANLAL